MLRARVTYAGLALATIVAGLVVHLRGAALGAAAQDVLGDALWAVMIVWWISALFPAATRTSRGVAALTICVAVELSQLLHTPALDALRGTLFGRLVLGSGFDPRDLLAYAVGVGVAVASEWWLVGRSGAATTWR